MLLSSGLRGADRPVWLERDLYPFQSRYLQLKDCLLHYIDEGTGPPILFLHAGPAWSFIYRNFIKDLRDRFVALPWTTPALVSHLSRNVTEVASLIWPQW